jgi:hypothetical protein
MKIKEDIYLYGYVAVDQELQVFAGYKSGYPYWSSNMNDYKEINNTTHLNTLRSWFPKKQIELIKI